MQENGIIDFLNFPHSFELYIILAAMTVRNFHTSCYYTSLINISKAKVQLCSFFPPKGMTSLYHLETQLVASIRCCDDPVDPDFSCCHAELLWLLS